MAAPRLRRLGFDIPERPVEERDAGHRLYDLLARQDGPTAHGRYNALVARMSSFARSAEHARPR